MEKLNKCCICSQIRGERENDLISTLLNESQYKRRIAIENEYFVVIPSLGALVPGHVLICPKKHFRSIAQMPTELDNSYKEIINLTKRKLEDMFQKDIHFFEHGASKNDTKIICTVDHAHLHLVPSNISIIDKLFREYDWIEIGSSLKEFRDVVKNGEYIYYESPDNNIYIAKNSPNGYASQYMRQVFAEELGTHGNWNWREDPNPEEANDVYLSMIE